MYILYYISVAFSCTFCTDVTDFTATDSVTFNAGETKASFPFLALCDLEEEGNEVVRLELEVQEQDRHRISIIGNDHIEVVIVGKRHTTPITVPLSSVIVIETTCKSHSYHAKEGRQDSIIFTQLCIILIHVQLCMILTHV